MSEEGLNSEPSRELLKEQDTPGQAENSRRVERPKSKKARDDSWALTC